MTRNELKAACSKLLSEFGFRAGSTWLPKGSRQYFVLPMNNTPDEGMLGISWRKPTPGKVVYTDADHTVFKLDEARNKLGILPTQLVPDDQRRLLVVGAKLTFKPYHPKNMDGALIGNESVDSSFEGYRCTTTTLNLSCTTRLGIKAKCEYLTHMISQVEHLRHQHRTIVQMLLDAGARDWAVVDPEDEDVIATPPAIMTRLTDPLCAGFLSIIYDRSMDLYRIEHIPFGQLVCAQPIEDVDITGLAEAINDIVGDAPLGRIEVYKTPTEVKQQYQELQSA